MHTLVDLHPIHVPYTLDDRGEDQWELLPLPTALYPDPTHSTSFLLSHRSRPPHPYPRPRQGTQRTGRSK